jgi:hypothetical protein
MKSVFVIVGTIGLIGLFVSASAQSGRRTPRRSNEPPPVAEPSPEPSPTPVPKPVHTMTVILGGDNMGTSMLSRYTDRAIDACAQELEQSTAIHVSTAYKMNRKDAIDEAKKQKENFVVLMEISADDLSGSQTTLAFQYMVFAPQTAKIKSSGTVYVDPNSMRNVGVGLPRTQSDVIDYGGRLVARRLAGILGGLDGTIPKL